jgi:hypothetical protein
MFTAVYWAALLQKAVTGGAAAAVAYLSNAAIGGNALVLDWAVLGGSFLFGFLFTTLVGLAAQTQSGSGPSFGNAEVLNPAKVKEETGVAPKPMDYEVPDHPAENRGEAG